MSFSEYLKFVFNLITHLPFNVFDYVIFFTLIFYVLEDAAFGLIPSFISFISTIGAFFTGLFFYKPIALLLIEKLGFTKGISDAASFVMVSGAAFLVISYGLSILRKKIGDFSFPKELNSFGGGFFGALSFYFIASFIVALLLSFPVSVIIKNSVRDSVTGRVLFTRTQSLESDVKQIFGGVIDETINFLTIKPESNETVKLNFSTKSYTVDKSAENEMLVLVNNQRQRVGLPPLRVDVALVEAARSHGKDMLERGYFSHYTPEGYSPFDRLDKDQISYTYAGENLALAPDVQIAMDGLMKSKGHRENILSPNFRKVGIGILNAGIYGEMFVQEFTD